MNIESRLTISASRGKMARMTDPTERKMAGMMLMVMSASFHCTASATIYAEKKSEMPVTQV